MDEYIPDDVREFLRGVIHGPTACGITFADYLKFEAKEAKQLLEKYPTVFVVAALIRHP